MLKWIARKSKWIFWCPEDGTAKSICFYSFWLVIAIADAVFLYLTEQDYLGGFISAMPMAVFGIFLVADIECYVEFRRKKTAP